MRIRLLCVGRTRTKHLEEALAEYIKPCFWCRDRVGYDYAAAKG